MSIQQALFASSFQFTPAIQGLTLPGAVAGVANSFNALLKRRYNQGYLNEDPTWFDGKTPDTTEADYTIAIDSNADYYSVLWTGYFYVPQTGLYRFQTNSDDGSYVWMGSDALSGYTTGNAIVNNGGAHGIQGVVSSYYQMTAGDYYPVRIIFGEIGGGDYMRFLYEFNNNGNFIDTGLNSVFVYNSLSTEGF